MQGGLQLTQGGAVLVTGVLAERASIPAVVGLWSVGGTILMAVLALRWPTSQTFDDAIAAAAESNPAPESELSPEIRPEIRPEPVGRARPEIRPEPVGRARPEIRPEPVGRASPEIRPEPVGRASPEIRPERVRRARPADLAEADALRRRVLPAGPHGQAQPEEPAGQTQDLGRRLEAHTLLARGEGVPAGSPAGRRPGRSSTGWQDG
jgi:hypothetical protein